MPTLHVRKLAACAMLILPSNRGPDSAHTNAVTRCHSSVSISLFVGPIQKNSTAGTHPEVVTTDHADDARDPQAYLAYVISTIQQQPDHLLALHREALRAARSIRTSLKADPVELALCRSPRL